MILIIQSVMLILFIKSIMTILIIKSIKVPGPLGWSWRNNSSICDHQPSQRFQNAPNWQGDHYNEHHNSQDRHEHQNFDDHRHYAHYHYHDICDRQLTTYMTVFEIGSWILNSKKLLIWILASIFRSLCSSPTLISSCNTEQIETMWNKCT